MSFVDASARKTTTLAERKRAEALRLKMAADSVVRDLRTYARDHAGRFVVFGSYVGDAMRFDSDLDVMIDFPAEEATGAWIFAEDLAARYALPLDLHDARTVKTTFLEKALSRGLRLS